MASPEDQALAAAEAAPRGPDGALDLAVYEAEYKRALAERHRRLMTDARASFRAMDGWSRVKSEEDWQATVDQADADIDSGAFFIERLGGARHLDPLMMAILQAMRRRLIDDYGVTTAAQMMLVDSAVLSFYYQQRISGWIGNVATQVEDEFFGTQSLTAEFKGEYGSAAGNIRGLKVEEYVKRLAEQLLPLFERSNRMLIRNLKALDELCRPPRPSVNIAAIAQMNVAAAQANAVVASTEPGRSDPPGGRRPRSRRQAVADRAARPHDEQAGPTRRRPGRARGEGQRSHAAPSPSRRAGEAGRDGSGR